ncbi:hypothetical protein U1Q18_040316 [Sarracenia purpurea var. burkii]
MTSGMNSTSFSVCTGVFCASLIWSGHGFSYLCFVDHPLLYLLVATVADSRKSSQPVKVKQGTSVEVTSYVLGEGTEDSVEENEEVVEEDHATDKPEIGSEISSGTEESEEEDTDEDKTERLNTEALPISGNELGSSMAKEMVHTSGIEVPLPETSSLEKGAQSAAYEHMAKEMVPTSGIEVPLPETSFFFR